MHHPYTLTSTGCRTVTCRPAKEPVHHLDLRLRLRNYCCKENNSPVSARSSGAARRAAIVVTMVTDR